MRAYVRQAPTEILTEQHYQGLQRLLRQMNAQVSREMSTEAGMQRLAGFQLPRVRLVGGVPSQGGCSSVSVRFNFAHWLLLDAAAASGWGVGLVLGSVRAARRQ